MSLTTPLLFIILFIVILYTLNEAFSLLIYAILLTYVFLDFPTFFTDTMSATIQDRLNLIVGIIALLSYGKMIVITNKARKSPSFEVD